MERHFVMCHIATKSPVDLPDGAIYDRDMEEGELKLMVRRHF